LHFIATHRRSRRISVALIASICGACLFASLTLCSSRAFAQEGLRNSLAGDAATEARRRHAEQMPFTFKVRDLRVLVTPSLGVDYNDNISISDGNQQSDVVVSPSLRLIASYPVTAQNLLSLNVGVGYQKYLEHGEHDTWFLQSGTELAFDISIKDFWINLHDRVSYIQDSEMEPTLVGTADYATINNTAGVSVTWDLNDATLQGGYDHANVISMSEAFNSRDSATESFLARAGFEFNSKITAGVEGTASFTTYDQAILNKNSSYSGGVYADWHPSRYFQVRPRVGYTIAQFDRTSSTIETSDLNSWYANLSISHQATDAITWSLSAGHEVRLGIQSDAVEAWNVRPGIQWNIIKNLALSTYFSYEHGEQGVGNITGNLTETYDWLGAGFNASYPIMKKLSLALNYRLTLRTSNTATRDYTQNVLGMVLTYHPQ
jgi:hypothetical protein